MELLSLEGRASAPAYDSGLPGALAPEGIEVTFASGTELFHVEHPKVGVIPNPRGFPG